MDALGLSREATILDTRWWSSELVLSTSTVMWKRVKTCENAVKKAHNKFHKLFLRFTSVVSISIVFRGASQTQKFTRMEFFKEVRTKKRITQLLQRVTRHEALISKQFYSAKKKIKFSPPSRTQHLCFCWARLEKTHHLRSSSKPERKLSRWSKHHQKQITNLREGTATITTIWVVGCPSSFPIRQPRRSNNGMKQHWLKTSLNYISNINNIQKHSFRGFTCRTQTFSNWRESRRRPFSSWNNRGNTRWYWTATMINARIQGLQQR